MRSEPPTPGRPATDAGHARELLLEARRTLEGVAIVVPHTDADGLASGAIALRARGEGAERAVLLNRGRTPFGADPPLPPGPAAVLDWGVRGLSRPGVIVDHHASETRPRADQVLVSGYAEGRPVSTAVLMRRVVPEAPAWLAAVGAVGDYGDPALKLPECRGVPRTAVRKLVPLVNAPRRLPDGPVRLALQLLVEHGDPRDLLKDPRVEELEAAKAEWRAGFDAAVRTAPIVGDAVALLRFASPYQVHPLVAGTWARRLAPRVVVAANDGYLPGRVNFAVRGGPPDADLRTLLRDALPGAIGGEFANGHDRATGGSLTPDEFDLLLAGLGLSGTRRTAARRGRTVRDRRRRYRGTEPEPAAAAAAGGRNRRADRRRPR
jgi:single-stranded-DNA-specific exonuclease